MTLTIEIKNGTIQLILKNKRKAVDKVSFLDEHNLGVKLLPEIDKLLKRNGLESAKIKELDLISDISDNFTTRRIAEAVKNAFNWSIRARNTH